MPLDEDTKSRMDYILERYFQLREMRDTFMAWYLNKEDDVAAKHTFFALENFATLNKPNKRSRGNTMMTMDVSKAETGPGTAQQCAGCGKQIQDRYLLRALDLLWHEDCLKCGCCDCRLGEVGSTLYTKANLILCKRDYLRLFGNTGYCAACNKVIPAFEMVMRARSNVYHLECFACQQCNHRFCVGDRFYLCENKILCEYDYEERLVFASMAHHPMLKRHANNLPPQVNNGVQSHQHSMLSNQQQQQLNCPPRGTQGDPNNNGGPTSNTSGYQNNQHLKNNGAPLSLGATS